MLAMLLEMTSTFSCWAIIPVAPMLSARIVWIPYLCLDLGDLVDRVQRHLVLAVDHLLGGLEIAQRLHHARELEDRLHVRAFDHALHDRGLGRHRRGAAAVEAAALAHQALRIVEFHDADLADNIAVDRYLPV